MKKLWVIGIIVIVFIIIIYMYLNVFHISVEGFEITIENFTEKNIEVIFLTCSGISKDIEVGLLKPYERKVISVNPSDYGENSIILYYLNKHGEMKKHTIVGYFEESYGNGYAIVNINNISDDGILDISSKYRFTGIMGMNKWH